MAALASQGNAEKFLTQALRDRDTAKDIAQALATAQHSGAAASFTDVTASGVVTAAGVTVGATGLILTLTNADVDAQDNTLTVAQILGGKVTHTSATAGGTVTTDIAATLVAGLGLAVGQSRLVFYVNDGDQTLTLAGGDGDVTISDTAQTIATNESAILLITRTAATTVLVDIFGA